MNSTEQLQHFEDWFTEAVLNLQRCNPQEHARLMADLQGYVGKPCSWEMLAEIEDRVLDSFAREQLMLEAQMEVNKL